MKQLITLSAIITGSLIATTASAQVYVNAHIGFGYPARRVYVAPPPPPPTTVVYQQPYQQPYQDQYQQPAPACQDNGYQDNGYQNNGYGYQQAPATVVYENDYPGYVYYNYPAWNGHYRDRFYYAHYRPYFERDYRGYFNRGRFDHVRFEREHYGPGRGDRVGDRGGYHGGYARRW